MNKKTVGRKGIIDLFFIAIILFALFIAILIYYTVISDVKEKMTPQLTSETSRNALGYTESAVLNYDYMFVVTFVMLIIFVIISSFFIRSHPIFFFISLILLVILILISAILSNAAEEITSKDTVFNQSASHYTLMTYFMGKLPLVLLVAFMLAVIVLFAKPWQYQGGGMV